MHVHYAKWRPQGSARDVVAHAIAILDEYQRQGLRMSLRQLYYQFVSRNLCENTPAAYNRLGSYISQAREAGFIDWDAIEDRGRTPTIWSDHNNIDAAVEDAIQRFRLPRLMGQPTYVELWVEKDALSGVLRNIASQYHIPVVVNRGYSSSSAMRESGERIRDAIERYGSERGLVIYLGDHDPSGEDMVRDITERLELFSNKGIVCVDLESNECVPFGTNGNGSGHAMNWLHEDDVVVGVTKLALTSAQVKKYKPPPNPAKLSDTRAKKYIKKHGTSSWEVDALPPDVLKNMIQEALEKNLNMTKMRSIIAEEKKQVLDLRERMKKRVRRSRRPSKKKSNSRSKKS
ncbi:MAG: hypothetical protein E6R03_14810 [Hyphomicrobiaceae bacterium]|nr:MAG: hypothetical protein E6R03_14810 [Hyphomicrobiaceae bacterium]